MIASSLIGLLLALIPALAQAQGQPQPPGTPWPESTYENATDPRAAAGAIAGQPSPPFYPSPWAGTSAGNWTAAIQRARDFVSQLTLTEKVNLTTGVGWEGDRCVGNAGQIPRLNFRGFCLQDSPLGVRSTDFVSAFSAGVMVAATWDRQLFYQRGRDMGAEHRDKGVDVQLGPVVGPLGRVPEAGRNWEGFSPDPVLSGIAVAETVRGIQSQNVIACTKHYILNEQEHFRNPDGDLPAISANIDDRTLHELYLWPFADAVRAGTASIMCSYNQINGSYACQNSAVLNGLLKSELSFQGFVVSDWGAQHSGISSALAGLDMTMPGDQGFSSGNAFWGGNLTIAVLNGTVPQYRLDDMAVRIMSAYYYVGRDTVDTEPNFSSWTLDTYGNRFYGSQTGFGVINEHVDVQDTHAAGIREVAAKGTVLLKNTGSLPLNAASVKLTGVFGEDAGDNPQGPNGCSDRGCDQGTLAMGWGSGTANFPYLISPYTALQGVVRAAGRSIEGIPNSYALSQITALAQRIDDVSGAAIVFANADAGEGYITVDNNFGDRNNITLWQNGEAVINAVASHCKNTIVVLHTVGPVSIGAWNQNPNITAILWAGIPGQESGNAIADVLYGKVNPSGKLPFTLADYRGQYGVDIIYQPNNGNNSAPQDNFREGLFIDYRVFDKLNVTPVYEFGYGLSYTNFTYSNLVVTPRSAPAYTPVSGQTSPAPTFGTISNNSADYLFPPGFTQLTGYIYPYLNSTSLATSSNDPLYAQPYTFPEAAYSTAAQPLAPASGAPGGNPSLWDVLYTATVTVTNTGAVAGEEVAQLYIALGGDNPKVVLRNFGKQLIQPGQAATFTFDIVRRDLVNWDSGAQDWVDNGAAKTVYVGSSSRKLYLSSALSAAGGAGGYASSSSAAGMSSSVSAASGGNSSAPATSMSSSYASSVPMSYTTPSSAMSHGTAPTTAASGQGPSSYPAHYSYTHLTGPPSGYASPCPSSSGGKTRPTVSASTYAA